MRMLDLQKYYCFLLVVAVGESVVDGLQAPTWPSRVTFTNLGDVTNTVINRDCIAGVWTPWTACSARCTPGGIQIRMRGIEVPATGNGIPCLNLREERACNTLVPCETAPTDMTITISIIPGQPTVATPSSDVPNMPQFTTPPTAGTPCTNKADGHYQQAPCSSEYYSCVAGIFIPRKCQGALVFDALTNRCDAPSNTYGCTGTLSTVPTTNRTMSTTTPAPEFDCTQLPNGFYANPAARNSCDNKYYACTNGITEVIFCPATLYFDQEVQSCQLYAYIPTCSGTPRTTVRTTTTTTMPTTQSVSAEPTGINCQTLPSGNYPNPLSQPPFCSPIYYTCSDGMAIRRVCQMGLYYDRRNNFCNFRDSIPDCTGVTPTPTTAPASDVTLQPTLPPVNFSCVNRTDGFFANPSMPCSPVYYSCTGGLARQWLCQRGLVFDLITGACQNPRTLFVCTGTNPTTSPTRQTASATQTATIGTPLSSPVDCARLPDGLYPNPSVQCSQIFYFCSNGMAMRFACPGNLYYDAETKTCAEFREVFLCTGTRSTRRPTTPTVPATTPSFDCLQRPDGRYANPLEPCSRMYIVCSGGVATRLRCPENLFFDQLTTECRPNDTVVACGGTPGRTSSLGTRTTSATVEFDCSALPNGLYADPRQPCNNFYFLCSAGNTYKQWCPVGSFFDDVSKRCDQFANILACNGSAIATPILPTATATTTSAPISDMPTFSCANRPDGNYPNPTVACSSTYFVCVKGAPEPRLCPKRQVFDPDINLCNLPRFVPVCGGGGGGTLADVTQAVSFCANLPDQSYPIPGRRCSVDYYECANGQTKQAVCPETMRFDPGKRICDQRDNVPECGEPSSSTLP
uniref:Chitin-binding type-2 domain-containing protein n=1 Tax=Trichuris muris TaxID=70415 RepID=A0A5S6R5S6_TRIMR